MNNLIENIIAHFEKLIGIALSEIISGDYNEALNSLEAIENLLNQILDHSNQKKSTDLFKYRKVKFSEQPIIKDRREEIGRGIKTFAGIVTNGLADIWKTAYQKEKNDICQYTSDILLELLNYASKDKSNFDLSITTLWTFSNLTNYGKENFKRVMLGQINKCGYKWYDIWVNNKINNYEDLDDIVIYFKEFRRLIWINLQYYVDSKNVELYSSLIGSLFDGFRFSWSYYTPAFYSEIRFNTDNKDIKEICDRISKFSYNLINLKTLYELQDSWKKFSQLNDQLYILISDRKSLTEYLEEIPKSKRETWEKVLGAFFFNNLKELVSFLAAYSLFVGNYHFIYELWYYNQPKDAASVNYGNRLLPETIKEIIDAFVKFDHFTSIQDYQLQGHHEIGYYYKQYLTLLFLRQYTLPQLYTYQDFLGVDYIPNTIEFKNLDSYINGIQEFKNRIKFTINSPDLLKELKLVPDKIFHERTEPETILKNLITALEQKKEAHRIQVGIDPGKVENFKHSIINIYKNKSFYRTILVNLLDFKVENNIPKFSKTGTSFGINEVTIKDFLSQEDEESYFGFPERFGNEIGYQENNVLRQEIISKFDNHRETKIDKILEILSTSNLEDKFIISWNIDFAYEVFLNEKGFIAKNELKTIDENNPLYSIYSGKYNDCDIYTHYDEIGWKGFIIIDKRGSGTIKQFSPRKKLIADDFVDHILLKVDSFSENEGLISSYLKNPPEWLKEIGSKSEQENHLRKQVNIQVAESIKVIFDDNFSGKSYFIRHDR